MTSLPFSRLQSGQYGESGERDRAPLRGILCWFQKPPALRELCQFQRRNPQTARVTIGALSWTLAPVPRCFPVQVKRNTSVQGEDSKRCRSQVLRFEGKES